MDVDYAHHSLYCEGCRKMYHPPIINGCPKPGCPVCKSECNQTLLMGMDHMEVDDADKYRLHKISDDF